MMKTLILSDIYKGTNNSIIPYALRWARNTGSRAEIFHIIDQRETQGVYSPYSDSQSITSGVELHPETLNKEKVIVDNTLRKYMSRELSLLNHPLKLDFFITIGNFEEELRKHLTKEDTLVLNCSNYDTYFDNYENLLSIIKSLPCQVLCVPGKYEFKPPEKALYVLRNDDERDTKKKQDMHNLLTNLQSYPKISSSYYAFNKEVEEKPANTRDFEVFYTVAPKNNGSGTKNIESLIQTLHIDLLVIEIESQIKNTEFKSLLNNNLPTLFTQNSL